MPPRFRFVLVVIMAAVLACSGHGDPPAGQEKGDCYPNGTCNTGLSCFSNRCVRYGGSAGQAGGVGGSGGQSSGTAGASGAAGAEGGSGTNGVGGMGAAGATGSAGENGTTDASGSGTGLAGSTGMAGSLGTSGSTGAAGVGSGMAGTSGGMAGMGGGTAGTLGAAGTAGSDGGTRGAGGSSCPDAGADAGLGETSDELTIQPCGNTPGTTLKAYSGIVTMTVSGLIVNTPGNPLQDPFYLVNMVDTTKSAGPCPDCFRYNRVAEGTCLCSYECPSTSHRVSDLLIGGYPPFSPSHQYTVTLDLGQTAASRLDFAIADCGCSDNSGTHDITITAGAVSACK
jgi:hypothetical protein